MIIEITRKELFEGLERQFCSFFALSLKEKIILEKVLDDVLKRCDVCFKNTKNKYYSRKGIAYFNPYHSGQYTIFLYYLSNSLFRLSVENRILCDKIYYLNKVMSGSDLFYEIDLPAIFMLDHPVGTVMGRAHYSEFFSFSQNCTVGNNNGIYPKIDQNVKMSANSMILGNSHIGKNTIIGANTSVKDQDIPKDSLVFGNSPNLIIKPNNEYV
jgi:serine O-acetyltransferase